MKYNRNKINNETVFDLFRLRNWMNKQSFCVFLLTLVFFEFSPFTSRTKNMSLLTQHFQYRIGNRLSLLNYSLLKKIILQITVSEFHQWNDIAGHVMPIILAMFYGNWSDRRGRKLPLVLGLIGKFIYSFMVVINSMMDTWKLNMVVYTATLPMSLLGGDVAIFGSCFAYISDVSSVQQRTLRITILDVIYLSTMPSGEAQFALEKIIRSKKV